VIKNIAPDISLNEIIYGVLPFVVIMILSVVLLCFMPEIATGLSDFVMGPARVH
jgi:TRAP-type C4-dicarboxylate transport system permease large subunit